MEFLWKESFLFENKKNRIIYNLDYIIHNLYQGVYPADHFKFSVISRFSTGQLLIFSGQYERV